MGAIQTAGFLSALRIEDDDGLPYLVIAPLVYDSVLLNRSIVVPVGFRTDLASIPRALWNILPKSSRYDRAAVVHDWLYWRAPADVTRAQADAVFREAMASLGVAAVTRWAMYLAVRVNAGAVWARYRAQDGAGAAHV
jgi:hypothetical protein